MDNFKLRNFGPIDSVNLQIGDMTIIVGEQALGKSIVLETFKLLVDSRSIVSNLQRYSFVVGKRNPNQLLNSYYGVGLASLWQKDSELILNDKKFTKTGLFPKKVDNSEDDKDESSEEKVFYIPAQRILCVTDGRPKNFMEFSPSTPYVLKQFSETIRVFLQFGLGGNSQIFPIKTRLKGFVRNSLDNAIFHDGRVVMRDRDGVKEMMMDVDNTSLPFMTWSAGQKEFLPLLLGFYCLTGAPTSVVRKENYDYVIIEEPEMGLHPNAILAVILQTLELIQNGFKVILSTHSTVMLEFAWAFNLLRRTDSPATAIAKLFNMPDDNSKVRDMLTGIGDKSINAYMFYRDKDSHCVKSHDISSLDVGSEQEFVSSWGGLSSFAEKAATVVASYSGDYGEEK